MSIGPIWPWAETKRGDSMKCTNCGADLKPGYNFCGQCGAKVENIQKQEEKIEISPSDQPVRSQGLASKKEVKEEIKKEVKEEAKDDLKQKEQIELVLEDKSKKNYEKEKIKFESSSTASASENSKENTNALVKAISLTLVAISAIFAIVFAFDLIRLVFNFIGGIF